MAQSLFLFFLFIITLNLSYAQHPLDYPKPNYPVPINDDGQLIFYIQRSMNTNTIVYKVNLKDNGDINTADPVRIFWLRSNGKTMPLRWYEELVAYGIRYHNDENKGVHIQLVSYDKLSIHLYTDENNKVIAETELDGKSVNISAAYVDLIDEEYIIAPSIRHVDVFGVDLDNQQSVRERFFP